MLVAFLSEPRLPQILRRTPHLPCEGFPIHSCLINPTLYSFSIESVALPPPSAQPYAWPSMDLCNTHPESRPLKEGATVGGGWGAHSERWVHSPRSCELRAKAAVAFCKRGPQKEVRGHLPPSWLLPLEYSGTSGTCNRRWEGTERVEREAGVRVCSGIILSAPRALWGGHQTILSWTALSSRDGPSPCAKLSPLSHCWVLAISQVRFSEASPDQTLF